MTCSRKANSVWTDCVCEPCRVDQRRMHKLQRTGRYRRVPSETAWTQVDAWIAEGFQPWWIATAAGINPESFEHAVHERSAFGPVNSAKIMSADIWNPTAGYGPARGSQRRLRALARDGWTGTELQARYGMSFVTIAEIQRSERPRVTAATHHRVKAIYDDINGAIGPSTLAAQRAEKLGWEPQFVWDNPDTDAEPTVDEDLVDEVKVERVVAGEKLPCTKAEQDAVFDAWLDTERPLADLFKVTGWNVERLKRRHRARETDLAA